MQGHPKVSRVALQLLGGYVFDGHVSTLYYSILMIGGFGLFLLFLLHLTKM